MRVSSINEFLAYELSPSTTGATEIPILPNLGSKVELKINKLKEGSNPVFGL